jgi:hypothetical protein
VGGEIGAAGPLGPQACRRLAGDGAVTRVLVTRRPLSDHPGHDPTSPGHDPTGHPDPDHGGPGHDPTSHSHDHGGGHGGHPDPDGSDGAGGWGAGCGQP